MNPPAPKRVKPKKPSKKSQKNSHKLLVFAIIAFVFGGGFYFTNKASTPDELDATSVVETTIVAKKDEVPEHIKQQRLAKFQDQNAEGGFDVLVLDAQSLSEHTTSGTDMSSDDLKKVFDVLVAKPEAKVAQLILWDDMAEDGDVVQLISPYMNQMVNLTNAHKTVYMPIHAGQPIKIKGIKDGGGGITLGFAAEGSMTEAPVLMEGESVDLLTY